jgi:hypothetical protein
MAFAKIIGDCVKRHGLPLILDIEAPVLDNFESACEERPLLYAGEDLDRASRVLYDNL